jgi:MFS transporter, DHA2 family, multidrug resistance protein
MAAVLPGVALAAAHSTMLDVSRTDLIDALDTDRYRIHWISDSYLLGSAIGMAMMSLVASRIGLRQTFLFGLTLFTAAAGACGFTSEIVSMTPLRWLQGLGNGLLICAGMVLIWQAFRRRREFAMAIYGMCVFVPAAAGFVIGGLLTAWGSWRWIFFINVPLGVIAVLVAWVALRAKPQAVGQVRKKYDFVGVALFAAMVVTMCVTLDMGQYWGWFTSRHFVVWFLAFVGSAGAFVAWGSLAEQPLISMRTFGRRSTTLGLILKVLLSINLTVLFGLLAVYMVNLRGYQWWQAGLVVLPAAAAMAGAVLAGIAVATPENRKLRILAGFALMSLVTWQLTAVDLYTSKCLMAAMLSVWGLGAGLMIGPALVTIFEGLSLDEALVLAGVFNISRALPAFAAAVILGTMWTRSTDAQFDTLRQNVEYNRPIVAQSYSAAQQYFVARGSGRETSIKQSHALVGQWTHANAKAFALEEVFRYLAMITAAGLIAALLLPSAKPQAIGKTPPAASRMPPALETPYGSPT